MDLRNKVAIVTGSGVRVGKALALGLAEKGVRLAVHYNASAGPAEQTANQIRALGGEVILLQADLTRSKQPEALLAQTVAHFGRIDMLVNSAAVFVPGDLASTDQSNWDQHMTLNLKVPFFLSQSFASYVGRERPGHIINILDWRAERPDPNYLAYSVSKAGLLAMTKALARAAAPNIQVNAIALGAILPPPGKDDSYLDQLALKVPLARIGSPQEVVKAMLYLLGADFVTGDVLYVTGGEQL